MKTKKFSKVLKLNKKTIVDLNNDDMYSVKGGATRSCIQTKCPVDSICLICTGYCQPDTFPNTECC